MGYQPLEDLLPRSGNSVYKLVLLAASRATELADGKPRLIECPSNEKTATIALEEIMAGKVELKGVSNGNEAKGEVKEAKKEVKKEKAAKV